VAFVLGHNAGAISVKLNGRDIPAAVDKIGAAWKRYAPDQPLRYTFLDERYAAMYTDVRRMETLVTSFAVLAIVVATLGLFALSAFTVEQRKREISIRRVLGATTTSIVNLLTGNFIKLVILSIVVAIPIAWFLMHRWLLDFAYRIEPGWEIFTVAGIIALAIAGFTITVQAAKAALGNTAINLRSE
jgi:putative ABC transport system permease protein